MRIRGNGKIKLKVIFQLLACKDTLGVTFIIMTNQCTSEVTANLKEYFISREFSSMKNEIYFLLSYWFKNLLFPSQPNRLRTKGNCDLLTRVYALEF